MGPCPSRARDRDRERGRGRGRTNGVFLARPIQHRSQGSTLSSAVWGPATATATFTITIMTTGGGAFSPQAEGAQRAPARGEGWMGFAHPGPQGPRKPKARSEPRLAERGGWALPIRDPKAPASRRRAASPGSRRGVDGLCPSGTPRPPQAEGAQRAPARGEGWMGFAHPGPQGPRKPKARSEPRLAERGGWALPIRDPKAQAGAQPRLAERGGWALPIRDPKAPASRRRAASPGSRRGVDGLCPSGTPRPPQAEGAQRAPARGEGWMGFAHPGPQGPRKPKARSEPRLAERGGWALRDPKAPKGCH
jgi:hypothetical protein